jgi:1,4-alpha-glucan branching enzyme
MIQRERKTGTDDVKVRFVLRGEDVQGNAVVVGDFNGWDGSATTFRRRGDQLIASITLPAGRRYAFRYRGEDGSWYDQEADSYEPNEFGGRNCVLDLT